jgi:hypothetical protein
MIDIKAKDVCHMETARTFLLPPGGGHPVSQAMDNERSYLYSTSTLAFFGYSYLSWLEYSV